MSGRHPNKLQDVAAAQIVADLHTNGPATPIEIAKRIGDKDARRAWKHCLRLANTGVLEFGDDRRTVRLAPTTSEFL